MTQVGNLLRAAKALISDPDKWTQDGLYITPCGCMCAQGALNRSFWASDYNEDVVDQATQYLTKTLKNIDLYAYITKYNDDPETTHADIMSLFDDAATMADTPPT
jgi:hypothetical protein